MDNFFDDPKDPVVDQPSKIKVGEREYLESELAELVKMGELGREVEEKYNTKLDRVYPEYTKKSQRVKELEDLNSQYERERAPKLDPTDEIAIREAREAARKVGLVTNEDVKEYMAKEFGNYYKEQRATERLLDDTAKFEGKYDGKDGRPRFKADEMLEFMRDTGISNPEVAYKVRFESELDKWKEEQLGKAKKNNFYTEDRGIAGMNIPQAPKITRDNLEQSLREELYRGID